MEARKIWLISSQNVEDFEKCRFAVDRVVRHACHGEFTADDIKEAVRKGDAFIYFTTLGNQVQMVGVWEMIFYPRMFGINVMAMGGRDLVGEWATWGRHIMASWKAMGAQFFEASVSPAMAKLMARAHVPLRPIYLHLRGDL